MSTAKTTAKRSPAAKRKPVVRVAEPPVEEIPAIFSRPRRPARPAGAYGGPNPGAYIRNAQGG